MIVSFRGFMAMGFLITEIFPFLSPVVEVNSVEGVNRLQKWKQKIKVT